jgi:hypothetical protein
MEVMSHVKEAAQSCMLNPRFSGPRLFIDGSDGPPFAKYDSVLSKVPMQMYQLSHDDPPTSALSRAKAGWTPLAVLAKTFGG